jgi:hypothetical protein
MKANISTMKIFFLLLVLVVSFTATAQRGNDADENTSFFKKENLFTGGSTVVSFGQGSFSLGIGSYFGYSINKYVDVAASFNYNYISERDQNSSLKYRQSILGPGAFVRVFPIEQLFLQVQHEYNFIKLKRIYGVRGYPDDVIKLKSQSTLIGGGYCSGRQGTGSIFTYYSIMYDISNDIYSIYRDEYGRKRPIFTFGINIPLFQGKDKGFNAE